ncbi:hypothetical protein [Flavobacterium sedimenticola]|uniref:Uncharacterized protein n=1 Tax=Flavobacterium sedimenticola TaxID=3043286 RepID=A0ABT6XMT9_9FLAO|nr:hypothetical protein [Flavobacterium sedimenticola]MDI9256323.1 hypothetical protein [Flavobacterium sedimenticola]
MIIVYTALILIGIAASVLWCKAVFWFFGKLEKRINKKKIAEQNNPYIQAHKAKMLNDKNYEEYLDWMAKNAHGVPVPKMMTREDWEASQKINRLTL